MGLSKSNVALIGFMGTGKSSVGKVLAERLKKKLVETDQMIEQRTGRTIPNIFAESEIILRELEMQMCKELSTQTDLIISTGGGIVLNKINLDYLKKNATIILLTAPAKTIFERISKDGKEKRPLLNKPDPYAEIQKLLEFRNPFYQAHADIIINCYQKSIDMIVGEILDRLDPSRKSPPSIQDGVKMEFKTNLDGAFLGMKTPDQCLICQSPLKLLENQINQTCSVCKQSRLASKLCAEGHFVCDRCYIWDFTEWVSEYIGTCSLSDPVKIAQELIGHPKYSKKAQEDAMIVAVALLIGIFNRNKTANSSNALGKVTIPRIQIAIQRAIAIPGDISAYYGIDSAISGVGIASSVYLEATPKRESDMQLSQKCVQIVMNKMDLGQISSEKKILSVIKEAMLTFTLQFNLKWS